MTVLAEGLFMPTGLLAVVYLVRRLGAIDYATFALAMAIIVPLQSVTTAPFSAAYGRAIEATDDWHFAVAALLRRHLFVTALVAVCVGLLAPAIATRLATPALGPILRVFALDIPLFSLGQAHRDILTGLDMRRWRMIGNVANARPADPDRALRRGWLRGDGRNCRHARRVDCPPGAWSLRRATTPALQRSGGTRSSGGPTTTNRPAHPEPAPVRTP